MWLKVPRHRCAVNPRCGDGSRREGERGDRVDREGDFRAVADWFSGLTGDEVETLCRLADRVLERLDP